MNYKDEILKSIQVISNRNISKHKADRTYRTVIKRIEKSGYVIVDETGSERTVQCCIPGVSLKAGQQVWVKEPLGDLKELHICGVCLKL